MDAAVNHLQQLTSEDDDRGGCARQLMASPAAWQAWESEFRTSLRRCTQYRHRIWQQRGLREASMSFVHRAAPFRFLRDGRVSAENRRLLMGRLHGDHSFSRALILEHGNFVRSECSQSCAEYIGAARLGDPLLARSVRRYERVYAEYFDAYCESVIGATGVPRTSERIRLLPLLKQQVYELRAAILEYPLRRDWLAREAGIRSATGETSRLRRLVFGRNPE